MVDLAMVLLGSFSVSIFLAHAIQAYRARDQCTTKRERGKEKERGIGALSSTY
jgi:hypothetical protein